MASQSHDVSFIAEPTRPWRPGGTMGMLAHAFPSGQGSRPAPAGPLAPGHGPGLRVGRMLRHIDTEFGSARGGALDHFGNGIGVGGGTGARDDAPPATLWAANLRLDQIHS